MPRKPRGAATVEKKNQQLERLSIEYLEPDKIKPNSYNPNRQNEHEFALLCKSIEEDGFTQPVIVSADATIVDGEHRWRAAQHLGLPTIPVVRVPMDAAQARIATLRHNRARGSEDIELSVEVLRDLEKLGALDWAADSLDLDDTELNRLLADIPAPETLAADDFSDAWAPNKDGSQVQGVIGGNAHADSTPAALAVGREQEARLKAAKTEEERQAITQDRQVFRLVLSFAGDEADLVRTALGDTPAQRIVELCRQTAPV